MNIYFTGSHGTGKTTTAKLLSNRTAFGILPSVSRNSPYKPGTVEHQGYVMDKVSQRTMRHDQTIQDRTPIDVLAYTQMMNFESEYAHQLMRVDRFLRGIAHSGEPLFYFPIVFPLQSDGVRPGKWEQIEVDSLIRPLLNRLPVNFYTMPSGTPEERVDFILERIPNA